MSNQNPAAAADTAVIDTVCRGEFRATYAGIGGGAAMGYGPTEDAARADLAATLAFNLAHNGRLVA
jgi:hypothetical protein